MQIKDIEILKSFLGENSLSNCEVMLKDLKDSKRIYSRFNEEQKNVIV